MGKLRGTTNVLVSPASGVSSLTDPKRIWSNQGDVSRHNVRLCLAASPSQFVEARTKNTTILLHRVLPSTIWCMRMGEMPVMFSASTLTPCKVREEMARALILSHLTEDTPGLVGEALE